MRREFSRAHPNFVITRRDAVEEARVSKQVIQKILELENFGITRCGFLVRQNKLNVYKKTIHTRHKRVMSPFTILL